MHDLRQHIHFSATALACALSLLVATATQAQVWGSAPQDSRQAAQARLAADNKLCAQEASTQARIQCRRDAQTLYDQATNNAQNGVYQTPNYGQAVCNDCARVTAVNVQEQGGNNGTVGMIAGGLAGAVLGHQVGGGFGKDLATIAGAAGGAYAGKSLAESSGSYKIWTVSVQYNDGRTGSFNFEQDPGLSVGTAVRNSGNTVVRN